jgi:hypothetical protein
MSAWVKEDKRLRMKKVLKKFRPDQPVANQQYPSKKALA